MSRTRRRSVLAIHRGGSGHRASDVPRVDTGRPLREHEPSGGERTIASVLVCGKIAAREPPPPAKVVFSLSIFSRCCDEASRCRGMNRIRRHKAGFRGLDVQAVPAKNFYGTLTQWYSYRHTSNHCSDSPGRETVDPLLRAPRSSGIFLRRIREIDSSLHAQFTMNVDCSCPNSGINRVCLTAALQQGDPRVQSLNHQSLSH
jgi:hypothetical protein